MIGLGKEEIEKLRIAGLLHDIGKLNIPIDIIDKTSKLTKDEFNIIKKHPLYSAKLLIEAGVTDKDIIMLVLSHHEKLNGLGYPYGLDNNSIPFLARILTICDCYDAMKSKRIYKEANDLDYIRKELLDNSGVQFDCTFVNLFLPYLENKYVKSNKSLYV